MMQTASHACFRYWMKSHAAVPRLKKCNHIDNRGRTVVKVLRYKSEGRWFDPSWCHLNFFIDIKSFRSHYEYVPGDDSASNRNEYQEYFLGVKAAGVLGLCRCHEIWEP